MGASKYIYTVYDAKTGEYVAKGTAAQLAGKGIFKDAGSVSTCYLSNRKTDKPRRWRMERVEVSPLSAQSGDAGAACSAPEVGALLRGTPQSALQTAPRWGAVKNGRRQDKWQVEKRGNISFPDGALCG